MHREEGLSFANVVTFNLDEYFPLPASNPRSYRSFMQAHLFDHVDIQGAEHERAGRIGGALFGRRALPRL